MNLPKFLQGKGIDIDKFIRIRMKNELDNI
jgi:hypothetical protein